MNIALKLLNEKDIPLLAAFPQYEKLRSKRQQIFERYLEEQRKEECVTILALVNGIYVGFVMITWRSEYPPFAEKNIPEISDLEVAPDYRRQGIATILVDEAEKRIFERSEVAGIGFGISTEDGPAQRMYVARGYLPDGRGLWNPFRGFISESSTVKVSDCGIYLTKNRGF